MLEAIQTSYPEEEPRKRGLEVKYTEEEEEERIRGGMGARVPCDHGPHTAHQR